MTVGPGSGCSLTSMATVPSTAAVGASVPFSTTVTAQGCACSIAYVWNFGDGSAPATTANTTHTYGSAGTFLWTMTASADGQTTSKTGSIVITAGCSLSSIATVPATATVGVSVQFSLTVTAQGCSGTIAYDWNFGDGTAHGTIRAPTHTYSTAGTYSWAVTASVGDQTTSQSGSIIVSSTSTPAPTVTAVRQQANPLRIRIDGTNFVNSLNVYIRIDTVPWPSVEFVSSRRIVLGGTALAAKFPLGTAVNILIVNPDGQQVATTFTRR